MSAMFITPEADCQMASPLARAFLPSHFPASPLLLLISFYGWATNCRNVLHLLASPSSCLFRFWFCFSEKSIWFSCLWYINIYSTVHTYTYTYIHIHTYIHIYRILILVCLLCLFRCCLLSLRVCCEKIFRQFRWYSFCFCFTHFTCSLALPLSSSLSPLFAHLSWVYKKYVYSL